MKYLTSLRSSSILYIVAFFTPGVVTAMVILYIDEGKYSISLNDILNNIGAILFLSTIGACIMILMFELLSGKIRALQAYLISVILGIPIYLLLLFIFSVIIPWIFGLILL